jgi:hypothetical protein
MIPLLLRSQGFFEMALVPRPPASSYRPNTSPHRAMSPAEFRHRETFDFVLQHPTDCPARRSSGIKVIAA